jgi:Cu/Ag efflux protein CusF
MMNLSRRFLLAVALAGMPVAFAHGQAKPVPVQGEVMRVNSAEGKVTLRHGPIPNLNMEGMSGMVFPLAHPAELAGLKPGDKVVFEADRVNGRITVTRIAKAAK